MRITYLLLFSVAFSTNAFAYGNYFSPDSLPPTLLVPPPSAESQERKEEIDQILVMQKTVTSDDKAQINAELHLSPDLFATAADHWDESHYPATFQLLDKALQSCMDVVEADKAYWNTTRPYLSDRRVQNFAGDIKNGSYPSGHAACSRVMAETLGQVLPQKIGPLRDRADEIGQHRILAGVHFPHDIRGGQQLAMVIMGALEESADFQADMQSAKKEWPQKP